jgi:preprotein translocase subunit YajC
MKKGFLPLLLVCLSTPAFADAAAAPAAGPSGIISNVLLLAGFLFIFYFMLIRPQTKRAKEQQNMIAGIAPDDEVVIGGGVLGKVSKVTDQFLIVSIADGVDIKVQKAAVAASLPKGTIKSI